MNNFFLDLQPGDAWEATDKPQKLSHRMGGNQLFSDAALARLIEATPKKNLRVTAIPRGETRSGKWRQGDMAGLTGQDVLDAVAGGAIWVKLRRAQDTFGEYRRFLNGLFAEIESAVAGFHSGGRSLSVLIASPNLDVGLHADLPGQMLWQIRGSKRLWIYPPQPPYLPQRALDDLALQRSPHADLDYSGSYDAAAESFDLEPGQWAAWANASPHRVRTGSGLNVSLTTEYWTSDLRARYAVNYANGVLRPLAGGRALSVATSGPAFWGKCALYATHRSWRVLSRRGPRATIDFRVDPLAVGGYYDVTPYEAPG